MSALILTHCWPVLVIPRAPKMIGEAATAFVHIFVGLLCQLPYILAAHVFVFNGLPKLKIANSLLFYLIYVLGLATASVTAIGASFALIAGFEAATTNAIWIATFSMLLGRIIVHSLWPITVARSRSTSPKGASVLIPENTNLSLGLLCGSFALHIVEFALVAYLTPGTGRAGLIVWTPFYLYIPGLAIHLFHIGVLAYHMIMSPPVAKY